MRADRLVATLLFLQSRGRVTAAEVADELEVSIRTARRDLDALGMAGDRQIYRSARRYYLRERLAVLVAVADVWLGREPG